MTAEFVRGVGPAGDKLEGVNKPSAPYVYQLALNF